MKTPASLWRPSQQLFTAPRDPVYSARAEVRQLNALGAVRLNGRNWQVAVALARQFVRLKRINDRVLVFYADTLIREIALAGASSTMVEPAPANKLHL